MITDICIVLNENNAVLIYMLLIRSLPCSVRRVQMIGYVMTRMLYTIWLSSLFRPTIILKNDRDLAYDIFKSIFLNENILILSID